MSTAEAFIVMPYIEPYEAVYRDVISKTLLELGFLPKRADQVPASSSFLDDIENGIRRANVVVVDASEANRNVYFEMGLAKALKKEMIILSRSAGDLPSDTRHIRHLVYDSNNLNELRKRFDTWLRHTRAFKLKQQLDIPKTLGRGDLFPDICDATMFLERKVSDTRTEILNAVRAGRLIPPKFIYLSDRGTQLWLDLCSDAEYSFFVNSVRFLRSQINHLLDAIDDDVIKSAPDIVSLGPGNGLKDRIILNALLNRQDDTDGYYYPFDISPNMVASAVRNIATQGEIASRVRVKAAITDFGTNLRSFMPLYQFRSESNIFLLLGNSLGNFEGEVAVLQQIRTAMFPGDYLLLEVRTRSSERVDLGGSESLNRRFDFSPLESIGVAFENEKFRYEVSSNLSNIGNTKTVVATYRDFRIPNTDEEFSSVQLSYIHEYSIPNLRQAIDELKLSVREQIVGDGFVYLLLRKVA